jgi:hypothetical protein
VSADPPASEAPRSEWLRGWPWLHLALCAGVLLCVYQGSYSGPFFSDDNDFILENPIIEGLSPAHLRQMFDPRGSQLALTATYAPLHMLTLALERALFGLEPLPWHVFNVLLHAVATLLLASLFLASRIPAPAALLGAALFGLHPALVEGVAWMSQQKTTLCAVFAFGALRALRARPGLATWLFVCALLTKPHAGFLLPTAAAFLWVWRRDANRPGWRWLALWAALFALYAVPAVVAFRDFSGTQATEAPDRALQLRSIAAVGARYFTMATTSWGVSAFAQPDPPESWLDPWWLAGLVLGAALAGRALAALRAGREEGAYWVFAAAGFAPVSQLFPFLFPIADRYLYFILPGLLGATLLALRDLAERVARTRGSGTARALRRAGAVAGIALAAFFGWRSLLRAELWREPTLLFLDSARHYPDGYPAALMRARRAAQQGDAATAAEALRAAHARGMSDFMALTQDSGLAPIAGTPEFAAVLREMAQDLVDRTGDDAALDQSTLHLLAHAHLLRNDPREAARAFAAAIRAGGLQDAVLRGELATLVAADPTLKEVTGDL